MLLHTRLVNEFANNKLQSVIISYEEIDNTLPYWPCKKILYQGQVDSNICVLEIEYLYDNLKEQGFEPTIKIIKHGLKEVLSQPTEKILKTKEYFIYIEFK